MKNSEKPSQIMYLVPNLFTAASCFFGVLSVVASINASFEKAIIYIFISLLLDGLDGRLARITNTTSKFGIEFDSLADVIAFGVAPAILFYQTIGHEFARMGVLASGMFVVFGAVRLARFNITTMENEPNVFIGLPIPTAAISIAIWINFYLDYGFLKHYEWVYIFAMMVTSLLMVSNIRYPSFKKIDFKTAKFGKILIIAMILLAILYVSPVESVTLIVTLYIFYGIFRAIYNVYIAKFKKR
ncbi:CDP-diacylglycerol--serine O-phosphatidyltransferase [Campylobacter geochelonis]|nr:CDP-diacylglycerol--serine O-phosphatidyltransferase [Campylobacter geochelonis]